MDNKLQKRVITALLVILALLVASGLAGCLFGAYTLIETQRIRDHSYKVISEITIVKNQYQTADYTGRNRNLMGNVSNINEARILSFEGLERMRMLVSDNEDQLRVLDSIKDAMQKRFASQDEQYQTLKRENGTISYNLDSVSQGSQLNERIENLFMTFQIHENNLLINDRQPEVTKTQWRLVVGLIAGLLTALVIAIYLCVKFLPTLARLILAERKTEHLAEKQKSSDTITLTTEEFNDIREILRGVNI